MTISIGYNPLINTKEATTLIIQFVHTYKQCAFFSQEQTINCLKSLVNVLTDVLQLNKKTISTTTNIV
jgi:hypothetical protein